MKTLIHHTPPVCTCGCDPLDHHTQGQAWLGPCVLCVTCGRYDPARPSLIARILRKVTR